MSGATETAVEAMAREIWECADDEVGWSASNEMAAAGDASLQAQVAFCRQQARAALAALLALPADVRAGLAREIAGDGWAVVPTECTDEAAEAICAVVPICGGLAETAYRVAIAASSRIPREESDAADAGVGSPAAGGESPPLPAPPAAPEARHD